MAEYYIERNRFAIAPLEAKQVSFSLQLQHFSLSEAEPDAWTATHSVPPLSLSLSHSLTRSLSNWLARSLTFTLHLSHLLFHLRCSLSLSHSRSHSRSRVVYVAPLPVKSWTENREPRTENRPNRGFLLARFCAKVGILVLFVKPCGCQNFQIKRRKSQSHFDSDSHSRISICNVLATFLENFPQVRENDKRRKNRKRCLVKTSSRSQVEE